MIETVDEGNIVVFGLQESYAREHEHGPEDSDEHGGKALFGAAGGTSGHEIDEDGEVRRAKHEMRFSGGPARAKVRKKFGNAAGPKQTLEQEKKHA